MVGIVQKTHPIRSIWYFPDEPQNSTSEAARWRLANRQHVWRPPTDVYEIEEALVVRVEIAGMRENDFTVSLEDRLLSVRGSRPDSAERRAYYQMEIPFGEFVTEVDLPFAVVADEIEATYRDGFLRIVLPKAQPHQIRIED